MSKEESNLPKRQLQLLAENVNTQIYNQRKYLLGRVLTIVDAVASDPEQRKACKDLVHDLFHQGSYWNEIKWQFNELSKAQGLGVLLEDSVIDPDHEPLNIYKEL